MIYITFNRTVDCENNGVECSANVQFRSYSNLKIEFSKEKSGKLVEFYQRSRIWTNLMWPESFGHKAAIKMGDSEEQCNFKKFSYEKVIFNKIFYFHETYLTDCLKITLTQLGILFRF